METVLYQKKGKIVSLTQQFGKRDFITIILIDFPDNSRLRIVRRVDKRNRISVKVTT